MAQKLWEKSVQVNEEIDRFTVGRDREMDLYLAKHDVLGSMAHRDHQNFRIGRRSLYGKFTLAAAYLYPKIRCIRL